MILHQRGALKLSGCSNSVYSLQGAAKVSAIAEAICSLQPTATLTHIHALELTLHPRCVIFLDTISEPATLHRQNTSRQSLHARKMHPAPVPK